MKKLLLFFILLSSARVFPQGAPACPNVTTGPTQTICQGQSATLTSTLVTSYKTTSYSVSSIPYAPYSFNSGTTILNGIDDNWSPLQNLLFPFCFYGTSYTQCVIGANGEVTFNTAKANAYEPYIINANLPVAGGTSTNATPNSICAVFRDIDPSVGGHIYYQTGGTSPCRYVVISWYQIPNYECTSQKATFQCVLYENTNYIDLYIKSSPSDCDGWNGGYGEIGIQDATASAASVVAPGRNKSNGAWSATNEAWRFTPTGAASYTFNWSAPGNPNFSTATSVAVSPTVTTTYTASMVITNCDGSTFTTTATQQVVVNTSPTVTVNSASICGGAPATLTASGATTYSWTPSTGLSSTTGSSVTANPGTTTVYSVTGTAAGCSTTVPSTVSVVSNPTITVTSATTCPGAAVTLTASGSTSYTWSTGANTSTISVSPSTATNYTVTGGTGTCTNTAVSTVSIAPALSVSVNSATICAGTSAALTASGATTYSWAPATGLSAATGASVTANPSATTIYTVTGNTGGCTGTATSTVSISPNPTITVSSASICPGNSTTLNAGGATTYTWSPSTGLSATTGASVTANPASTTTYTVTGTAGTCTASSTGVLTVNSVPVVSVNSPSICNGSTATLNASGANTYNWTTGLSSTSGASVTGSPSSTSVYTVTGASVAGCTATATSTITVNPLPNITVNNASICNGAGPATLTAAGAITYSWSPGLSATTGASVTGNPSATTSYTVTGTDANTCTNTAVATITVISNPTLSVNSGAICTGQTSITLTANSNATTFAWSPATGLSATTGSSVTASPASTTTYSIVGMAGTCTVSTTAVVTVNTPPTLSATGSTICVSQQTGSLTVSGASTYTWTGGGITGNTTSNPTDNPVTTTTYTVNATGVNTCTATATAIISVNPLPTVTVNNASICLGQQTATLTASGATSYSWSPGLSATTGASVTGSPSSTTSYTVTGTDANNCTNTAVSTITVIANPTITVNSGAICQGQTTIVLSASSNATSFAWSPSTGLSATSGSSVTASPATVGNTIYTITGSAGSCTVSTTATVTVNAPPVPTASANTPCETEQALNLTSAPAAMTSYTWSGPNSFTANVQNPSITTLSNVTQASAGTYTVVVTDNNTCVGQAIVTVTVNSKPLITATGATVCVGQTISLSSSGAGSGSYNWNYPNSQNSPSQNPSIPNATTSMSGIYNVVGTDANGCYSAAAVQVLVNPNPVITVNSGAMCATEQTVTLTASSGNAGTNFSWSPSTGLNTTAGATVIANPSSAGNYTYTVTGIDANSCMGDTTTVVVVYPLPVITTTSSAICIGQQTATLTATGGGTSGTYTWSPSAGLLVTNGSIVTGTPSSTQVYTVTGTDGNGCYSTSTATITVYNLPVPSITSNTPCVTQQNLNLSSSVAPTGTYTYSWSGPSSFTSVSSNPVITSASVTNSVSGTYSLTVTDVNGCYSATAASVAVHNLPIVSIANSGPMCLSQGHTVLTASGASTYVWSPTTGLNSASGTIVTAAPSNVGANIYTVTATDANGCVNTDTTRVVVYALPIVSITPGITECVPVTESFTVTSTPASSNYTWNFGDGNATITTISTASNTYTVDGNYIVKVTVKDIHGCINYTTTTVSALSMPSADFDYGPQPVSVLAPEVNFANYSTPGLPHYYWNFGDISNASSDTSSLFNPTHIYPDVGTYSVTLTVSTAKGCSATIVKPVVINEDYALYVPNAFTPNGDGTNDIFMAAGEGIKTFKLYIFDRWGLLIFYSDDIKKGWDGTMQGKSDKIMDEDTYVWKIEASDYNNKNHKLAGQVNLIK